MTRTDGDLSRAAQAPGRLPLTTARAGDSAACRAAAGGDDGVRRRPAGGANNRGGADRAAAPQNATGHVATRHDRAPAGKGGPCA